jgi:aryl-alcohol dehydrogenase-like predicted oxidoreductase
MNLENLTGPIVLGTMNYGTTVDEKRGHALLDHFVEQGGTWIDTANCYSFWNSPTGVGGQSEAVIGSWLRSRPGARDSVLLSTKVRYQPLVPHSWPASAEGLSAGAIRRGVAGSLERLGTEHVDLLWAHGEDRSVPLVETVGALGELAASGAVKRLGASNHAVWRVERARALARELGVEGWTALQLRHTLVAPRPGAVLPDAGHVLASEEALDYVATEPGLSLWAYTPLLNGSYVRDDRPLPEAYDHPGTERRLSVLADIAAETGATRNQVVLAWLMGGEPAISPIVGVSTLEQLDEAMAAAVLRLDAGQRARLAEAR